MLDFTRVFASREHSRTTAVGVLLAGLLCATPRLAQGSCNLIPGTARTFRSTLGVSDRPFARPGDIVELSLATACDASGFLPSGAEHAIAVVFTPPAAAAETVLLADDCSVLGQQLQADCAVPADRCIEVSTSTPPLDIEVFTRSGQRRLRFRFPDTDLLFDGLSNDRTITGPARVAVFDAATPFSCSLLSAPCSAQSGLIACIDEFFETDGTCGTQPHSMFPSLTALPPPNSYQDLCFDPAPPCTGTAPEVRFTTDAAGNVLLPMDWRGILVGQGVPIARLLRGSTAVEAFSGSGQPVAIPGNSFLRSFSPEGGLLPPIFDPQSDPTAVDEVTLFGSADAPETVLRIARRSSALLECGGGDNAGLPCGDDGDCPNGACNVATSCSGGPNTGQPCPNGDVDCDGDECGQALFEFRDRYANNQGPVIIDRFGDGVCQAGVNAGTACSIDNDCPCSEVECPGGSGFSRCVLYRLQAQDPVPLEGLNQTEELSVFVAAEGIDGHDLNGDSDSRDDVIRLADRQTGVTYPIGLNGSKGLAVSRIRQPPFSFPTVAMSGAVAAFLESEPAQGYHDANANARVFDTILRAFRLNPGAAIDLVPGTHLGVDAAPFINGRSLVISGNFVFFREAETGSVGHTTSRVSLSSDGTPQDHLGAFNPALSEDGRFVAFASHATNLVAGDLNGKVDIFVRDRDSDENGVFDEPAGVSTSRVSVASNGVEGNNDSFFPALSADGRFVVFVSLASNLVAGDTNDVCDVNFDTIFAENCPDVFIHDRDSALTTRVSVASNGDQQNGFAHPIGGTAGFAQHPVVSSDGRYVAFGSSATNLVDDDTNLIDDVFVHDRDNGTTERVSVDSNGAEVESGGRFGSMTPDGRFVTFLGYNIDPRANNGGVFVHDRVTGNTELVSVSSSGQGPNVGGSVQSAISADGRYVAFESLADNLVAGDTNGLYDVFLHDRQTGSTTRISVSADGSQAERPSGPLSGTSPGSFAPQMSADGRLIAFMSRTGTLVPDADNYTCDDNGDTQFTEKCFDVLIHDRWTGHLTRMNLSDTGADADGDHCMSPAISGDGRYAAFHTRATNLVTDDSDNKLDVYVRGVDTSALVNDITGDLQLDDTVLATLDTSNSQISHLCPAEQVVVSGARVAFLRPEWSGDATGCPAGPDLNLDGDNDDLVVHLIDGGTPQNLGRAATAIALSNDWLAALVPSSAPNTIHSVAQVRQASGGSGTWVDLGEPADEIAVEGPVVAFVTAEYVDAIDRNDDGDSEDRVLQLYFADSADPIVTLSAIEDFVMGPTMIAVRVAECSQGGSTISADCPEGGTDLNGDGDADDGVLQLYDTIERGPEALNTQQAVTPCRLEACDPRLPYRVFADTAKFLTFEADQAEDLNGDGDSDDLVLQTYNLRLAQLSGTSSLLSASSAPQRSARTMAFGPLVDAAPSTITGAVSGGICTDTGESCATDDNCPQGTCFVPPGGCVLNLGTPCSPASPNDCGAGQFCRPSGNNAGTCHEVQGNCLNDADCTVPASCSNAEQGFQRLVAPLSEHAAAGELFTGSGVCIETLSTVCTSNSDCSSGARCIAGSCSRTNGHCKDVDDCAFGSVCRHEVLVAAARDFDGDELADPFDNCPFVPNIAQEDGDLDGVGDACDLSVCGDGVTITPEQCDDGDLLDGNGCDSNCTPTACGNAIVTAGEHCDDGNLIDADGCDSHCLGPICGDTLVELPEQCDDGNTLSGDCCSASCQFEGCPVQDVAIAPLKPIDAKIRAGDSQKTRVVALKVRNPSSSPVSVELLVDEGDCPGGIVGAPDFDKDTSGEQTSTSLAAGKSAKAALAVTVQSAAFGSFNSKTPTRCTLRVTAKTVPPSIDPTPWNDSTIVEINVIDLNDAGLTATHESSIRSGKPLLLNVGDGKPTASKKLRLSVGNADFLPQAEDPGHSIALLATPDPACPFLTVGAADCDSVTVGNQPSATVKGGKRANCSLYLTATSAQLSTPNKRSPQRCTLTFAAEGPSSPESAPLDPSNNTTTVIVDLIDKNDF